QDFWGSVISAFIIGSGCSLTVGLAAGNGRLNVVAILLILTTGAVAAAKDYRSLKQLPPVPENGQPQPKPQENLIMKLFWITLIGSILTGCSTFHSSQTETKSDGTKIEQHQLVFTFWDAQSQIAKLRASTTD